MKSALIFIICAFVLNQSNLPCFAEEQVSNGTLETQISEVKIDKFSDNYRFLWKQFKSYCKRTGEFSSDIRMNRILFSFFQRRIFKYFPELETESQDVSSFSFANDSKEPYVHRGISCDVLMHVKYGSSYDNFAEVSDHFLKSISHFRDECANYKKTFSDLAFQDLLKARANLKLYLDENGILEADKLYGGTKLIKIFEYSDQYQKSKKVR